MITDIPPPAVPPPTEPGPSQIEWAAEVFKRAGILSYLCSNYCGHLEAEDLKRVVRKAAIEILQALETETRTAAGGIH